MAHYDMVIISLQKLLIIYSVRKERNIMRRLLLLTIPAILILAGLAVGCSGSKKYHETAMPDPKAYNAHFGDMDADGDAYVNWEEFAAHFQNADKNVFKAIDLNQDGNLDHDEWHEFKEAHGLKHQE